MSEGEIYRVGIVEHGMPYSPKLDPLDYVTWKRVRGNLNLF